MYRGDMDIWPTFRGRPRLQSCGGETSRDGTSVEDPLQPYAACKRRRSSCFASRRGRLKRAGRVLKVLINRVPSNMFGKDLHFHTGTSNYCDTPNLLLLCAPPPSPPKLLTAGSLAVFLLFDILKTFVPLLLTCFMTVRERKKRRRKDAIF